MNDQPIQPGEGILHHAEGVDLIPANIELAGAGSFPCQLHESGKDAEAGARQCQTRVRFYAGLYALWEC